MMHDTCEQSLFFTQRSDILKQNYLSAAARFSTAHERNQLTQPKKYFIKALLGRSKLYDH